MARNFGEKSELDKVRVHPNFIGYSRWVVNLLSYT